MEEVKRRFIITFVFISVILVFTGCSQRNSMRLVKDGYFPGYEQTTIGRAFNAFFDNPNWKYFKTENGTQFIEFTGELPNEYTGHSVWEDGWLLEPTYPKGAQFVMQFIIKQERFEVRYSGISALLFLNGVRQKTVQITDREIREWLALIYQ